MINLNDHINVKEELLKDYTELIRTETLNNIMDNVSNVLDKQGCFYYIDLLDIIHTLEKQYKEKPLYKLKEIYEYFSCV